MTTIFLIVFIGVPTLALIGIVGVHLLLDKIWIAGITFCLFSFSFCYLFVTWIANIIG